MKKLQAVAIASMMGVAAFMFAHDAQAALVFTLDQDQDGNLTDPAVQVTIVENAGTLEYTIEIVPNPDNIGDLRGSFIEIALPDTLDEDFISVTGTDVTQFDTNTSNLGGGNNVNPLGPFTVGIEIGTAGIGGDDIQSTSFVISHDPGPLTLAMVQGQPIAVRITSVGPADGEREGSLKVTGTTPVPEPATLALLGIGLLGAGYMARRRRLEA